ncbi:MAG: hypothetical protein AAF443_01085 [Chlamydiota bacterium]
MRDATFLGLSRANNRNAATVQQRLVLANQVENRQRSCWSSEKIKCLICSCCIFSLIGAFIYFGCKSHHYCLPACDEEDKSYSNLFGSVA